MFEKNGSSVPGSQCRPELWILDFWILDFGFGILGSGFWILGFGLWICRIPCGQPSLLRLPGGVKRLTPFRKASPLGLAYRRRAVSIKIGIASIAKRRNTDPLDPPGNSWDPLGPPGTPWDNMGPPGTPWDHLGQPGTPWDPLGPLGPPWDPPGIPWDPPGTT